MDSVMEIPPHTPPSHPPTETLTCQFRCISYISMGICILSMDVGASEYVRPGGLQTSVCVCVFVCVCMYVCMYVCGACVYVCMYVVHVCLYYVCAVTCTEISPSSHLCREGVHRNFEYMCMRWYTYTSFMDCRALHPPSPADPYEDWIYFFRSVWSRWGGDHSPRDTAIRLVSDHQV